MFILSRDVTWSEWHIQFDKCLPHESLCRHSPRPRNVASDVCLVRSTYSMYVCFVEREWFDNLKSYVTIAIWYPCNFFFKLIFRLGPKYYDNYFYFHSLCGREVFCGRVLHCTLNIFKTLSIHSTLVLMLQEHYIWSVADFGRESGHYRRY